MCDKTPNTLEENCHDVQGALVVIWGSKNISFLFPPLKKERKKRKNTLLHALLCILYCNLAILMVHFSPMCVHSEAPIDLLLLSISGVSIGRLHTGYELLSTLVSHCVLIRQRCSLYSCRASCLDTSYLSQLFNNFLFGFHCTACDGKVPSEL